VKQKKGNEGVSIHSSDIRLFLARGSLPKVPSNLGYLFLKASDDSGPIADSTIQFRSRIFHLHQRMPQLPVSSQRLKH
jgi:hypothetical protein